MHQAINVFLFHSARKDISNQSWSSAKESGIDGDDVRSGLRQPELNREPLGFVHMLVKKFCAQINLGSKLDD